MSNPHLEQDPDARIERFKRLCRQNGYSVTQQRVAIYAALARSLEHPTPEGIHAEVVRDVPNLSLATVYKAIETFKSMGLVQEVNPLHDRKRLDANMGPHHHLVCVRCRKIVDIPEDAFGRLELPLEYRQGFKPIDHAVQFNGLCPDCQRP